MAPVSIMRTGLPARARMPKRSAAARKRDASEGVDIGRLKTHWAAMDSDARLRTLRFTDPSLVERAFTTQQMLHSSEMAVHSHGLFLQFNEAGESVISTGLRHFKFDYPAVDVSEDCAASNCLVAVPDALFATHELVDREDFFEYLDQQLGGFLVGGKTASKQGSSVSAFEPAPHTWTQYERQILRLVEVSLLQVYWDIVSGDRADTRDILPELTLSASKEADDELVAALAPDVRNSKKAKKKLAARHQKQIGRINERVEIGAIQDVEGVDEEEEQVEDEESTPCSSAAGSTRGGSSGLSFGTFVHSRESSMMSDGVKDRGDASIVDTSLFVGEQGAECGADNPTSANCVEPSESAMATVVGNGVLATAVRSSSTWSAWLPNEPSVLASQWNLIQFDPKGAPAQDRRHMVLSRSEVDNLVGVAQFRVGIRRTFLDIIVEPDCHAVNPARRRARSAGSI